MTYEQLGTMVYRLHRCQCENEHCDICVAVDNGFNLLAARILDGATETPPKFTAKVGRYSHEEFLEEIARFKEAIGWAKCPKCDALLYGEDGEQTCSNCLHAERFFMRRVVKKFPWRRSRTT